MAAGGRAKKRTPSDLLTWGVEVCCLKIQASSLGAGVGGWGAAQLGLVRAASSSVPRLFNALRRHLPGAGSALVPLEQGLLVNACNFMTDRVEECELKALECETIASSLAAEMIRYVASIRTLRQSGARRHSTFLPINDVEMDVMLE